MTLAQWLEKIEALRPEIIKLGLERIAEVAKRLAIERLPGRVICVAGTNGKGSTIALLDALAQSAGLSTSVYTSPHLFRFSERIRQQGEEVSDEALVAAFDAIEAARGEIPLTYFEFTTLAAFQLFCQQPTDLYLLEVGLGGRLDAVNLIDADVSVITSVGLDHTDWLGNNREAIGREKAGIARAARPLLYGEQDMPASVAEQAETVGARLLKAGDAFAADGNQLSWHQGELSLSHAAKLGNDNLVTALAALACVDVRPEDEAIAEVAASTSLPGRCQRQPWGDHELYFDVGHNREALSRFAASLPPHDGRTLALAGMLNDKPAEALLALADQVDDWFLTELPGPRGKGVERFRPLLPKAQLFAEVTDALAAAREALQPGDRLLVTGSFLTVMAVQQQLATEAKPSAQQESV